MAVREGKCTNFENCAIAKKKKLILVPDDMDFTCYWCGKELTPIGQKIEGGGSNRGVLLVVAAAVVVVLFLIFVGIRTFSGMHGKAGGSFAQADGSRPALMLSGSNTIGSALAPALAQAFLSSQGATDVRVSPGSNPEEQTVQGTLPGASSPSVIRILAHGSATAFTDMGNHSADIGMASRRIKPDEVSSLSSLGDMTAASSEHVLGLDGIAVIVSSSNPVHTLTKDQITGLFSGEVKNWSEVGGANTPVKVLARDDNSGTYDTFKTLVLGSKPLAAGTQRFEDNNELSAKVSADPGAVGFVGLPYIHDNRAVAVSDKGATALQPTRLTVATEDYPLSRRLFLYTPANPTDKFTRKFVEFALSNPGQDVVGKIGFVAQNVTTHKEAAAPNAPGAYKQLTSEAERLSLNFRFKTGKADLDNKAVVDIDRVISFIADQKLTGSQIALFGFSDSVGSAASNQALSLSRAKVVQDQFIQRGLKPTAIHGFGADMPVASNDTEDGREKNRRVEIWLLK